MNARSAAGQQCAVQIDGGVREVDGQLAGLATFHVFELVYRRLPHCRLTALVVDQRHRRRGVGALLVEAVEGEARRRGCSRVELTTRPGRGEAMPFYTALGYVERPHRLLKAFPDD